MSEKDKSDVYVFFAGHGLASSDGQNMFLLPYDGDPGYLRIVLFIENSYLQIYSDIASFSNCVSR